ncbi:hypothetical protein ACOI1H_14805 [Loktanella sp. DJP18]|uniref:hypothetical protein n=1 Tax=Loktanella sp. DJP18 TaxID=3409788 RepID=UPI003BB66272
MDMISVLDRIAQRSGALNLTLSHVSQEASGSRDLIRNWQRRARQAGGKFGARPDNLTKVADVLGVSYAWLVGGDEAADVQPKSMKVRSPLPAATASIDNLDIRIDVIAGRVAISADLDEEGLKDLQERIPGIIAVLRR